jgi:DnaJ-domain-containing protein 1
VGRTGQRGDVQACAVGVACGRSELLFALIKIPGARRAPLHSYNRPVETLLVLVMIGAGVSAAVVFMTAAARRDREAEAARATLPHARGALEAAILHEIALAGGAFGAEAERIVADETDYRGPFHRRIDLTSWAESYARGAVEPERHALLESAVKLAVAMSPSLPARQYHALLDLSFGLGFHADALARLRARWRFEYSDYARLARPREAEGTGAMFRRITPREKREAMKSLGLSGELERAPLISAYRRLAAEHHPDRVHDRGGRERDEAARRFIEITEAYETLLALLTRNGSARRG